MSIIVALQILKYRQYIFWGDNTIFFSKKIRSRPVLTINASKWYVLVILKNK